MFGKQQADGFESAPRKQTNRDQKDQCQRQFASESRPGCGNIRTGSGETFYFFGGSFVFVLVHLFPLQVVGLFGPSALHVFNGRTGLGGQDFFTETFVVDTDNGIPVSQPELPGCFFND